MQRLQGQGVPNSNGHNSEKIDFTLHVKKPKKPKCILALSIRDQNNTHFCGLIAIWFVLGHPVSCNSRRSKVLTRYTNETFIANGFTWFEFLNDFKWTFWSHILSNLGNELTILQKVKIHYNFEIIFSKLKSLVPVRFYSYDFWRRMLGLWKIRHSAPEVKYAAG